MYYPISKCHRLLFRLFLCWWAVQAVSCTDDGQSPGLLPDNEPASLSIGFSLPKVGLTTRAGLDDPDNYPKDWSEWDKAVDGRILYRVTVFLIDKSHNNRLVAYRDLFYNRTKKEFGDVICSGDVEASETNDNLNYLTGEDETGTGTETETPLSKDPSDTREVGVAASMNFSYNHPLHGDVEKLHRGAYRLVAIANYSHFGDMDEANALKTADNKFLMEELKNKVFDQFDKEDGLANFDATNYGWLFNSQIATDNSYIVDKSVRPQPLTLVQDIELQPGQNHIEAQLVRTYARIRIEVENNSKTNPLTVNSLKLNNPFAQEKLYLFDDPDNPDRKYAGITCESPNVSSTNAIIPFKTGGIEIPEQSSQVIFDGYILESNQEEYTYTLGVEYKDVMIQGGVVKAASVEALTEVDDVKSKVNGGYMFFIRNVRSNRFVYENEKGQFCQENVTLNDLVNSTFAANKESYRSLWELVPAGTGSYHIRNVETGHYANDLEQDVILTATSDVSKACYYTLRSMSNSILLRSNTNTNLYWNDKNNAYVCGWPQETGYGNSFYFYPVATRGQVPAAVNKNILLQTINPVTAAVTPVTTIHRNDFIRVLVSVFYSPHTGDFNFIVKDWEDKKGSVEFN